MQEIYGHRCKNRCGEREENEQTDQMVTMGQRTTENERALSDGASDGVDVLFFFAQLTCSAPSFPMLWHASS
jgi:hypothetical protein